MPTAFGTDPASRDYLARAAASPAPHSPLVRWIGYAGFAAGSVGSSTKPGLIAVAAVCLVAAIGAAVVHGTFSASASRAWLARREAVSRSWPASVPFAPVVPASAQGFRGAHFCATGAGVVFSLASLAPLFAADIAERLALLAAIPSALFLLAVCAVPLENLGAVAAGLLGVTLVAISWCTHAAAALRNKGRRDPLLAASGMDPLPGLEPYIDDEGSHLTRNAKFPEQIDVATSMRKVREEDHF